MLLSKLRQNLSRLLNAGSSLISVLLLVFSSLSLFFPESFPALISGSIYNALLIYVLSDLSIRILFRLSREHRWSRLIDLVILAPLLGTLSVQYVFLYDPIFIAVSTLIVALRRSQDIAATWVELQNHPARLFTFGFLLLLIGSAILLYLPLSLLDSPSTFIDALFMASSALCVTGLTTHTVSEMYSSTGQWIILTLIQLGGLGIMAFYAVILMLFNRKFSQREQLTFQESVASQSSQETRQVLRSIFVFSFLVEAIGALILFFLWRPSFPDWGERLYFAVFHAISAFCNAGISLFPNSLFDYADHAGVLLCFSILIIAGGLGFPVMVDLFRKNRVRYRVQTQLAIGVSGILIVISTLLIFFIESGHTFAAFSLLDQWSLSLFHAVSSRTAGFHAIPISWFHPASIFVIIIFMFIGASPGSTGGGIKTTTVGVLVKSFWSTIRGESDTVLFERRIGSDAAYRALAIMVISLACIIGFVFLLLYLEPLPFLDIVFEVVSAFGTVGYSLGKTAMFHPVSKLLLIILMIIGRLGPLSIAIAFTQKKSSRRHRYPEERILLG